MKIIHIKTTSVKTYKTSRLQHTCHQNKNDICNNWQQKHKPSKTWTYPKQNERIYETKIFLGGLGIIWILHKQNNQRLHHNEI